MRGGGYAERHRNLIPSAGLTSLDRPPRERNLNMNLSDIIALAKQGYKPADIRELISLGNEQEQRQKQPDPQPDPEPIPQPEPAAEPAPEPGTGAAERPPEPAAEPADKNTPDPQIEDLKRQIAELQAANARRGQPDDGQKSNEEILAEMAKGFV